MSESRNQTKGASRVEAHELLRRSRALLNKFAVRYGGAEHIKKDQKEARLLIEAIDELLLRL